MPAVSPKAGTRPDASLLVDIDELLAAYRRPPEAPVSFGTSGHRGSSLKGTFTEAHVLAISEAISDRALTLIERHAGLALRHAIPWATAVANELIYISCELPQAWPMLQKRFAMLQTPVAHIQRTLENMGVHFTGPGSDLLISVC